MRFHGSGASREGECDALRRLRDLDAFDAGGVSEQSCAGNTGDVRNSGFVFCRGFGGGTAHMNSVPLLGHACQLCGAQSLHELDSFRLLPRVTSDANPWPAGGRLCVCLGCGTAQKAVDAQWRDEIAQIYGRYQIYHQSGGAEQPIFSGHACGPLPRSILIAELIDENIPMVERASVLDFGCGNGATLRSFSSRHPNWRLYGSELSDAARQHLKEIDNFVELFTGALTQIHEIFDLVTLIHSLEHVIEPKLVLDQLRELTKAQGRVFVQVPDCAANPYDLVIADHLTHFSLEALCHLGSRAGYETVLASDSFLPKELTWIGRRAEAAEDRSPIAASQASVRRVGKQLNWLRAQAADATEVAHSNKKFGIFGTSISGTWLAGAVGEGVAFFVDEDPGRIGRTHMGRPIVSPEAVDFGSEVYIPLISRVGAAVAARLQRPGCRYHTPPDHAL